MSLMEGKEDIFKEFKEKFKSTYMVSDSPLIIIVSRVSASSCLVLHDWLYFLVKKSQMYFRYSYIIILIFFYDTFKQKLLYLQQKQKQQQYSIGSTNYTYLVGKQQQILYIFGQVVITKINHSRLYVIFHFTINSAQETRPSPSRSISRRHFMTSSSLLDTKPILVMTYKTKSVLLLLKKTHRVKYCQKYGIWFWVSLYYAKFLPPR